jgi:hypothetical protein
MAKQNVVSNKEFERERRRVMHYQTLLAAVEDKYLVSSRSSQRYYLVDLAAGTCECLDYQNRRNECWHQVQAKLYKEQHSASK